MLAMLKAHLSHSALGVCFVLCKLPSGEAPGRALFVTSDQQTLVHGSIQQDSAHDRHRLLVGAKLGEDGLLVVEQVCKAGTVPEDDACKGFQRHGWQARVPISAEVLERP